MHKKYFQNFLFFAGFGGKNWPKYESDCGTSMDMHTAHSTEKGNEGPLSMSWLSRTSSLENDHSSIGAKYLLFVSSRSVKLSELSFPQFVDFLGKVCLFFNFRMIKFTIMSNKT